MNFSVQLGNKTLNWNEDQVRQKLEGLSNLHNKKCGWIHSDLSTSNSWCITRVFWTLIAKHFNCLRSCFYNVDLDKSKAILEQLKPQVESNPAMTRLFNQAVDKFETIAPKHKIVAAPSSKPSSSAHTEPSGTSESPKPTRDIKPQAVNVIPAQNLKTQGLDSVKDLMTNFDKCWDPAEKKYKDLKFDTNAMEKLFKVNSTTFKPIYDPEKDWGVIQKKDVPDKSKIFVRADLHGDLKSLMENLKTAQEQGLLDANFKCKEGVQLVFLGDYEDRGDYTMQVLQLLMSIRLENPGQVTLIRGNHEDTQINSPWGDKDFSKFMDVKDSSTLLTSFYESLTLSLYMSVKTESGERQYVQYTHGLFELYVDPTELLDSPETFAQMIVSKEIKLSERVKNIEVDPKADYQAQLDKTKDKGERKKLKLLLAAQKIKDLVAKWTEAKKYIHQPITIYNWGDMGTHSHMEDPGYRHWKLSPADAKNYLRLCSAHHKVKLVFRGHEHRKQHHEHNGKVVVSTMPVGMDVTAYARHIPGQLDTAYILTAAPKVKDWTKNAYLRAIGESTKEITKPYPIRSTEV